MYISRLDGRYKSQRGPPQAHLALSFDTRTTFPIEMSRLSQEVTRIITLLLLVQYFGHVTAHRHFAFTKRQNSAVGCLRVKGVPAVDPWDERYTNYSSPYNLRLQYKPEVIALAETNEHVSAAVRCACRSGLKVQARSGGHSYASYGMGGVDGALIVDTQRFQDVSYDENSKVATFGAGVRLGNLALALQEYGRAVPHGTCSNVGVGGHFTHGGNGFTSRAHGMAIDSLVAMDVVLADGTLVHATATEHSDVFFVSSLLRRATHQVLIELIMWPGDERCWIVLWHSHDVLCEHLSDTYGDRRLSSLARIYERST